MYSVSASWLTTYMTGIARLWEQLAERSGGSPAEERRPQQEARHHLGDDLRLSQTAGEGPDEAARREDDGELEQELNRKLKIGHSSASVARRER